jgi:hypothetical protein
MLKIPADFGIDDNHLVQIDLEGESEPHFYPPEYVVIESTALVVGDEIGVRVASYPYSSYQALEDGTWQFRSDVGDYILKSGPAYQAPS